MKCCCTSLKYFKIWQIFLRLLDVSLCIKLTNRKRKTRDMMWNVWSISERRTRERVVIFKQWSRNAVIKCVCVCVAFSAKVCNPSGQAVRESLELWHGWDHWSRKYSLSTYGIPGTTGLNKILLSRLCESCLLTRSPVMQSMDHSLAMSCRVDACTIQSKQERILWAGLRHSTFVEVKTS